LENQSDHSGVLVRIASLDRMAITDAGGTFSFEDMPDGLWLLETSYPYFGSRGIEIEVRDGLQRSPARVGLRQLLRFWVELKNEVVSFCECEQSFEFPLTGYVENLTNDEVTVACGSSPLEDYAIVPQSLEKTGEDGAPISPENMDEGQLLSGSEYDFCRTYEMILPGMLDMPGFVKLSPREVRSFDIDARPLTECFEDGPYNVFWALVDCSNHWEHYAFDDPPLNNTLLFKPNLLTPAPIRLIETSAD
jgi:hypothetical protein